MQADAEQCSPVDGNTLPGDQMAFSVKSVARILDLSERVTWDLVTKGKIPSFKIGASRRVSRAALEAYVEHLAAQATHPPAGPSTPPPPPGPKSEPLRRAG